MVGYYSFDLMDISQLDYILEIFIFTMVLQGDSQFTIDIHEKLASHTDHLSKYNDWMDIFRPTVRAIPFKK